jgi:hypothetical protein
MAKEFTIERSVIAGVDGGFIAFGPGADIDEAFDAAVTTERFELGSSGLLPSIVDVDPAAERRITGAAGHPWAVTSELVRLAGSAERGTVLARSVTSLTAWKLIKTRLLLEDPALRLPDVPGLIIPLDSTLEEAVRPGAGAGELLGVELLREPRRRYKVIATSIKGPRNAGYAVIEDAKILSVHASASEARRAAMELAKSSPAERHLEVRPHISRNDRDPYLRVDRGIVAQKATVKAITGELKNPDKTRVIGWVFAGRI